MKQEINNYFDKFNCKVCHKPAKFYRLYKDEYAYLCNDKECAHKFNVKSGVFAMNNAFGHIKTETK